MFSNLYKLYHRNSGKRTPLEDFNTEVFVGVLNYNKEILNSFIDFLELDKGDYSVKTQRFYKLDGDDSNCYVDMVLECNHTICFIENKVNSKEGWEQLERYSKALDNEHIRTNKKTYLKYCTKYNDPKQEKRHGFSQFRWYEIAQLLKEENNHTPIAMVEDYILFLEEKNMTLDTSFTNTTVDTMATFRQTYSTIESYIEKAHEKFKIHFPNTDLKLDNNVLKNGNISMTLDAPFIEMNDYASIYFAIAFDEPSLHVEIWVEEGHKVFKKFVEAGDCISKELEKKENDCPFTSFDIYNGKGARLIRLKFLNDFINEENPELEINNWFDESFKNIKQFIDHNSQLGWKPELLSSLS